jgi:hypothetical protein
MPKTPKGQKTTTKTTSPKEPRLTSLEKLLTFPKTSRKPSTRKSAPALAEAPTTTSRKKAPVTPQVEALPGVTPLGLPVAVVSADVAEAFGMTDLPNVIVAEETKPAEETVPAPVAEASKPALTLEQELQACYDKMDEALAEYEKFAKAGLLLELRIEAAGK